MAPLFHLKKKKKKSQAKEWSESPVRAKKKGSGGVKVKLWSEHVWKGILEEKQLHVMTSHESRLLKRG